MVYNWIIGRAGNWFFDKANLEMKYIVEQIQLLCKAIAKMRAGNRCEICGELPPEGHHIFFGASKADWQTWSNPDFYASVCSVCHRTGPAAAHVDNKVFLSVYLPKIDQERRQAVMARIDSPAERPAMKCPYKAVLARLKEQYEELESTCWMDADMEPEYGRAR